MRDAPLTPLPWLCALLGLLAGCSRVPAQPPDEELSPKVVHLTWRTGSPNGLFFVQQTATDLDACTAAGYRHHDFHGIVWDSPLWSVRDCLTTRSKQRFLADDGASLLVFDPSPDEGPLPEVEAGALYREGRIVRRYLLREFGETELRREGGKLYWLEPGEEARLTHAGLELSLRGGRSATIAFDGSNPKLKEPRAECQAGDTCTYVDDRGETHVVDGAEVPASYRRVAHRASGDNLVRMGGTHAAPAGGSPAPAPAPSAPPSRPGTPVTGFSLPGGRSVVVSCTYLDADGKTHRVSSLDEVPAEYKKDAACGRDIQ